MTCRTLPCPISACWSGDLAVCGSYHLLVWTSGGLCPLSACLQIYHHCCSLLQFHRASCLLGLLCRLYLSPHPQTRQGEPPLQHHPNPGDQVSIVWGRGCDWSLPALAWFPSTSKPSLPLTPLDGVYLLYSMCSTCFLLNSFTVYSSI